MADSTLTPGTKTIPTSNENYIAALTWLEGSWQAADNRSEAARAAKCIREQATEIERLTREVVAVRGLLGQEGYEVGAYSGNGIPLYSRPRPAPETCELQQLRRIDKAARAFVDARPGKNASKAYAALSDALFDGRPTQKALEAPPAPTMQARFCDYKGPLVERDGKMVCPECGNS